MQGRRLAHFQEFLPTGQHPLKPGVIITNFSYVTFGSAAISKNRRAEVNARSTEKYEPNQLNGTLGFPSQSSNGFGFVRRRRRLPSGGSLSEAMLKVLETGPLHN